ncbi:ATP-binding cassette domain-containing protein [Chamaesiphon sp. VAR_69_metabat_338]|uniref:ABC transporter ATP-binding protein n=1 Tax=Chamaesiphon sp. VAR_69_metabat_338 TaxID=2964704 RepID=UPI00286E02C4|nr:ATP-binding cassette domain-containing protein [Chamaesiphon sp. VAR_69_metabat_338]
MEVISLDRVSLWRRTQEEFSYDIKQTIFSIVSGKYRVPAKKLVIDDVNLTIDSGEKIGIIGGNGAGKSTLLKLISGILEPSLGKVRVHGHIAPLIELGAGFDGNISVQSNIIMYGVLLGFSRREMAERTPTILDFAELNDYALVPVKGLSSGMVARLGFAIATDVQPDILILDEVLSVGDQNFKNKCQHRIDKFLNGDTTVLVVSHDLDFISASCDKAIWLERGRIKFIGSGKETVARYLDTVTA